MKNKLFPTALCFFSVFLFACNSQKTTSVELQTVGTKPDTDFRFWITKFSLPGTPPSPDTVFFHFQTGRYMAEIPNLAFENDVVMLGIQSANGSLSMPVPLSVHGNNSIEIYKDSLFTGSVNYIRLWGNDYLNAYQELLDSGKELVANRLSGSVVDTLLQLDFENTLELQEKEKDLYLTSLRMLKEFGERTKSSQMFYLLLMTYEMQGQKAPTPELGVMYKHYIDSVCNSVKHTENPLLSPLCVSDFSLAQTKEKESTFQIQSEFFLESKISTISSSLIQNKVIVLDFWATWCKPCIAQMPRLDSLIGIYDYKQVACVAVCIDQTFDKFAKYMEDNNQSDYGNERYKNLVFFFDDGQMKNRYGITTIPANFVYNKEGKLVAKNLSEHQLKQVLDSLLVD